MQLVTVTLQSVINAGDIQVKELDYKSYIGGLIGYNAYYDMNVMNCFNWGNIGCPDSGCQYDTEHIGGLLGYGKNAETTFANCYNTGEISETGFFGGIVGRIYDNPASVFFNCYYADTCPTGNGIDVEAGLSKTITELKQQATFAGFEFTDKWEIIENESFPVLQNLPVASVSGLSIDESLDLKVRGMAILTLDVVLSNAVKQVSWSSSDESVAIVSGGVVSAVGKGSATITVTTKDGCFADTCSVTVTQQVTGISLNKSTSNMLVGETDMIIANVEPSNASDKSVTWSSSNESVATIADGVVTSVAEGCAIITVTTEDGGFTDTCTVNVIVPQIVDGQLHYVYYNPDSSISREVIYYGVNDSSNIQKINYYTDGIRTSYRLFNESGNLRNLVELYSGGQTKKINYYNTSSGNRYAYKLYDTSGRMTHYIFTYSNGKKPEKTNYYDVVTGKRTSYKLYDTQGRTTHLISCHPDGAKPEKTNYYNVSTGIRTSYKLYDTKGRTTRYAICYSDGVKAKKMNCYNVNTGIRWGYKTYRTNGTCSCYVKCDSEGKPSVATYYDEDGNVTKVERY